MHRDKEMVELIYAAYLRARQAGDKRILEPSLGHCFLFADIAIGKLLHFRRRSGHIELHLLIPGLACIEQKPALLFKVALYFPHGR